MPELDAIGVAERMVAAVAEVVAVFPRGEGPLRRQLRDAADSACLNLFEGAGRFMPADKARFYDIANGSAVESVGALRIARIRGLAPVAKLAAAEELLDRVSRMVTALAISARRRGSG